MNNIQDLKRFIHARYHSKITTAFSYTSSVPEKPEIESTIVRYHSTFVQYQLLPEEIQSLQIRTACTLLTSNVQKKVFVVRAEVSLKAVQVTGTCSVND